MYRHYQGDISKTRMEETDIIHTAEKIEAPSKQHEHVHLLCCYKPSFGGWKLPVPWQQNALLIIEQAVLAGFQMTSESIHLQKKEGQKSVNSLHTLFLQTFVCFIVRIWTVMSTKLHRRPLLRMIFSASLTHNFL